MKFVIPSLEIVANVRMVSRMLSVMNNVMVDIMERDVCFNVGTVWMIKPVTTLMEHVQVDVCQDGRTQRSVKNDPDTLYVAVIAALVAIIVILIAVITVPVVVRNTCKKRETNSQINEVNMYDLPYEKPESSEYNVIFAQ